jgi:hypothetical protein
MMKLPKRHATPWKGGRLRLAPMHLKVPDNQGAGAADLDEVSPIIPATKSPDRKIESPQAQDPNQSAANLRSPEISRKGVHRELERCCRLFPVPAESGNGDSLPVSRQNREWGKL